MVKSPFEVELINAIEEVVIEIRTKSDYLKKIHENLKTNIEICYFFERIYNKSL